MVAWHHRLTGHEFEQALGDSEVQASLECRGTRSHKESDTMELLNKNNTSRDRSSGLWGTVGSWPFQFRHLNSLPIYPQLQRSSPEAAFGCC